MHKTKRTVTLLSFVAVLMFGFGFALVPLYDVFCQALGLNGRNTAIENGTYQPNVAKTLQRGIDTSREVTVQFVADQNKDMAWEFRPLTDAVTIHPGKVTTVRFYAKNLSDKPVVARAIPSMQPSKAVKYFTKMECFCFNNQTFLPGEAKEMALIFVVDRDLPKSIDKITQSYTFFDTKLANGNSVAEAKQPATANGKAKLNNI